MIDKVCEYICSKMASSEWVSLHEISEIFKSYGLEESDVEAALVFLKKYFFELDNDKQRARLSPGFYNFYGKILGFRGQ